jgi:Zn-dependent M16 (insulinase) family peptidase
MRLDGVRKSVIDAGNARIVEVGSKANQQAIAPDVERLLRAMSINKKPAPDAPATNIFRERLAARDPKAKNATFVGLFAPSTSSGVFVNLAPSGYFGDASDDSVLDYLAGNLYTGHGAHSIFMKTWAAGLAYSNGMRRDLEEGVVLYYAERCPLLPQTLRFVIEQLKKGSKPDPNIARYAIAKAFDARVANGFEQRASTMASNLVDGLTPDVQKAFRTKVLAMSKDPQLADKLFGRMQNVYSRVLPGYGSLDPRAIYFVIGPDKQLTAYQEYLKAAVAKDATLHRLYPRDFWIPATVK